MTENKDSKGKTIIEETDDKKLKVIKASIGDLGVFEIANLPRGSVITISPSGEVQIIVA